MNSLSIILLITGVVGYILCFILDKGYMAHTMKEPVKFHNLWNLLGIICFLQSITKTFISIGINT